MPVIKTGQPFSKILLDYVFRKIGAYIKDKEKLKYWVQTYC